MAIAPYRQSVRQEGVDATRQQAPNAGFGEGVGEAISGFGSSVRQYAQAVHAYQVRFDEAAALELDSSLGEELRPLESGFLRTQGRETIDGAAKAEADWEQVSQRALSRANGPRQREALEALLQRRRDRFRGQLDNHLAAQTETYTVQQETSHLAILSRDVAGLSVGSGERVEGYVQLGQALDHIANRRGYSPEARQQLGFETFSGLHVATVQSMLDADPVAAKGYMLEHREQIDPTTYARLFPQVRDEANNRTAETLVRGELLSSPDDVADVDGESVVVGSPIPPGSRMSSGFGPRRSPGGVGSSNHRGVDWAVPVHTPVVAALPGVVSIKSDPDGYGTYIEIDHGNGQTTRYAHLSSTTVEDGARVGAGDRIALSGGARGSEGAGNSQGAHLHFEYLLNGTAQDPTSVIGQQRETGGSRELSAPTFRTLDDVVQFAEREAPDDWRLREAIIQRGTAELQRDRSQRDDREDEARRALDQWLVSNPNATWDQVPANLKNGVSPSYRLSVQNSRTPSPGSSSAAGDTVFNALADEAAADPEAFAGRDFSAYSGIITPGQMNTLLSTRRRILTNRPNGTREADTLIRGVSGVVNGYVQEAFGPVREGRTRPPDEEAKIAAVRESLFGWVEDFTQRERREPTQAEMIGQLRVFLAPVGPRGDQGGETLPYGAAVGRGFGFRIPRAVRRDITAGLTTSLRRAPTEAEISEEYARRVRAGNVDLGTNLY